MSTDDLADNGWNNGVAREEPLDKISKFSIA